MPGDLEKLLTGNPNVQKIRFKNLMVGDNQQSVQAEWVKEHRISKDKFEELARRLLLYNGCKSLNDLISPRNNQTMVFEKSGNYPKDVVFCNGRILDYLEKELDLPKILEMARRQEKNNNLLCYNSDGTDEYDNVGGKEPDGK